ncbi:MAG: hypothetical protein PHU85_12180 [Phycisphaerae bacterium]|nr:hypothetical protein [Phycisphaerae bacterium]
MMEHADALLPIDVPPPRPARRLAAVAIALMILGAALCALALRNQHDRSCFAVGWLWAFCFVVSISLGSLFFLALHYLTHSIWSVVVKRVADMLAASLWLTPVLFIPVALFVLFPNRFDLFPWLGDHGDHEIHVRREYLNAPFFLARGAACVLLWSAFAWHFVRRSVRQDRADAAKSLASLLRMRAVSAPFMLVFAVTLTAASVDWLMSLEPNWISTMFGVYIFAGFTVTGLATLALATVWLRATGRLPRSLVSDGRLYSFGGLMFAFVSFWGYIAFSQYMLTWYANLPEESFYMVERAGGRWLGVSVALALVRFAIPFLVLLPRRAKMSPRLLVATSLLLIGGQLLDLYWLIARPYHSAGPAIGWQEVGPLLFCVGLLGLFVAWFVSRYPMVAAGDPMMEMSRRFRET